MSSDWLEIGKIVAAQGLQGEVRVYPDSDFAERFEQPGQRWLLAPTATTPTPIQLLQGRYLGGKGLYVLQLEGVTNREQAEALRGYKLLVPSADRLPLEEGEFHVADLIGLTVFLQATQTLVGTVVDVVTAGNDLLVVERSSPASGDEIATKKPADQVFIPFVEEIVPVVDLEQGRIELTPPVGLI